MSNSKLAMNEAFQMAEEARDVAKSYKTAGKKTKAFFDNYGPELPDKVIKTIEAEFNNIRRALSFVSNGKKQNEEKKDTPQEDEGDETNSDNDDENVVVVEEPKKKKAKKATQEEKKPSNKKEDQNEEPPKKRRVKLTQNVLYGKIDRIPRDEVLGNSSLGDVIQALVHFIQKDERDDFFDKEGKLIMTAVEAYLNEMAPKIFAFLWGTERDSINDIGAPDWVADGKPFILFPTVRGVGNTETAYSDLASSLRLRTVKPKGGRGKYSMAVDLSNRKPEAKDYTQIIGKDYTVKQKMIYITLVIQICCFALEIQTRQQFHENPRSEVWTLNYNDVDVAVFQQSHFNKSRGVRVLTKKDGLFYYRRPIKANELKSFLRKLKKGDKPKQKKDKKDKKVKDKEVDDNVEEEKTVIDAILENVETEDDLWEKEDNDRPASNSDPNPVDPPSISNNTSTHSGTKRSRHQRRFREENMVPSSASYEMSSSSSSSSSAPPPPGGVVIHSNGLPKPNADHASLINATALQEAEDRKCATELMTEDKKHESPPPPAPIPTPTGPPNHPPHPKKKSPCYGDPNCEGGRNPAQCPCVTIEDDCPIGCGCKMLVEEHIDI